VSGFALAVLGCPHVEHHLASFCLRNDEGDPAGSPSSRLLCRNGPSLHASDRGFCRSRARRRRTPGCTEQSTRSWWGAAWEWRRKSSLASPDGSVSLDLSERFRRASRTNHRNSAKNVMRLISESRCVRFDCRGNFLACELHPARHFQPTLRTTDPIGAVEQELAAHRALEAGATKNRDQLLVERPVQGAEGPGRRGHSERKTPVTLPRMSMWVA
jgi:hypothetical protein